MHSVLWIQCFHFLYVITSIGIDGHRVGVCFIYKLFKAVERFLFFFVFFFHACQPALPESIVVILLGANGFHFTSNLCFSED